MATTRIGQKNGYAIFNNSSATIGVDKVFKVKDTNGIDINLDNEGNIQEPVSRYRVLLKDEMFNNQFDYLITGYIDKNKNFNRKIKVYLENDEGSSKFDIATINIDIGQEEQEEELFKIAFRPGKSTYRYLIFENIASNDAIFQFKPKTIMQLSNIFDNMNIIQFGLQADPGFIFLINGEPMRVGRTGFFESPEGYEISNVGVTEPNFIIDYKYKVVKGVN
jgi:hypothetical protein